MRHNLTYTIDRIEACIFAVLAALCIYGAIAKGAWWHIGTAVICTAVPFAHLKDAIGNEDEEDLE
jgi:hypothetical protein